MNQRLEIFIVGMAQVFAEARVAGRPLYSFEFFPPKTPEAEAQLRQTMAELSPLKPDFVSITYGAGGTTRDRTLDLTAEVQRDLGIQTICHLTCVGHSRDELRGILTRLRGLGIGNILALRGDPPKGSTTFTPHPDGLRYAGELVSMIRDFGGFDIAVAGYPEKHVESPSVESDLLHTVGKVRAGACSIVTQLFFSLEPYVRFVEACRRLGVPDSVPVVPGIMPITNVAQVKRFTSMCGATLPQDLLDRLERAASDHEVVQVGIDAARQLCEQLLQHGAPGVHFYTLNRSTSTREVFKHLPR